MLINTLKQMLFPNEEDKGNMTEKRENDSKVADNEDVVIHQVGITSKDNQDNITNHFNLADL